MDEIFERIYDNTLTEEDIDEENINSILVPNDDNFHLHEFYGTNPFLFAVMTGNSQHLELLKNKGANPYFILVSPQDNILYRTPTSPMGNADYYYEVQDEARQLKTGRNALLLAIEKHNPYLVQRLHEEYDFPFDYIDHDGNNLAHIAILSKAATTMDYLLSQNPELKSMRNNDKMTPLELARYLYYSQAICALEALDSGRSCASSHSARSADQQTRVDVVDDPAPELITKGDFKFSVDLKTPFIKNQTWDAATTRRIEKNLDKMVLKTDDVGRNIMHYAVMRKSQKIFILLLQKYPQLIFEQDSPKSDDPEAEVTPKTPLDYILETTKSGSNNDDFVRLINNYLYDQIDHYEEPVQKAIKEALEKNGNYSNLLHPAANVVYTL